MFADFYHTFYYVSLIIGALVSMFFMRRASVPVFYLCLLIVATLVSELIAKYIAYYLKLNSNIVYHFFVVVEYAFYSVIFFMYLKGKAFHRALIFIFILFLTGEVLNTYFFQSVRQANTNMLIIEALLLVVWALYVFKQIREDVSDVALFKKPAFWIASAVLVYYSLNTLIWGFHSIRVYNMKSAPLLIYNINLLLSGVLYLVYSFSIIVDVKYTSRY